MHRCMLISRRVRQTLRPSGTPRWRDFLPAFTRNQVTRAFPLVRRFMVAQPLKFPVARGRLVVTWQSVGTCDWVEPGSYTPERPA